MSGPPRLIGHGTPCPRCLYAAMHGKMRTEAVLPLPAVAPPRSRPGNKPCCHDCALADTLVSFGIPTWDMARTAVANDRQEQLRLPGAPIGLVQRGMMRPNETGDLERHHKWLADQGLMR
jgi:hypothetical protein